MKNELNSLLQKQMDRKDFVKHVAIGFAAIAGVTTVLKTLSSLSGSKTGNPSLGYGSSAYGGQKNDAPKQS